MKLNDVTFLLYVKIDSNDRSINLELVLNHINKYLQTNTILLEVDEVPKISKELIGNYNINYEFMSDTSEIFHTTKYRNILLNKCKTKYFFICDIDVIVNPESIFECVDYLRKVKCPSIVYPYNGKFYNVSRKYRDLYSKSKEYEFLQNNEEEHKLWINHSVGGIFGSKKNFFYDSKVDNEEIYGWGPDDKERYYRLKKKGFKVFRTTTSLYHLYHSRNRNSSPASEYIRLKNQIKYLDVLSKRNSK